MLRISDCTPIGHARSEKYDDGKVFRNVKLLFKRISFILRNISRSTMLPITHGIESIKIYLCPSVFLGTRIASRARRKHDDPEEVQRQVESTGCDSHKAEWRTKVPGAENRKVSDASGARGEKERENKESQVEREGREWVGPRLEGSSARVSAARLNICRQVARFGHAPWLKLFVHPRASP